MSLDVTLIHRTETCPHCNTEFSVEGRYVFDANITHNMGKTASEAGIYKEVWRPDENGITRAWQLIEPLTKGIELLRNNPEHFKQFDPSNGWGSYDTFVPWLENYLDACKNYPNSFVHVSR